MHVSDPIVVAALIAFLGVLVSVGGSFLVNKRAREAEEEKLRTGLTTLYAQQLLDKRIDSYAQIYCKISDCAKKLWYNLDKENEMIKKTFFNSISELQDELNILDSKHGIFFSPDASGKAWTLRMTIQRYIDLRESQKDYPYISRIVVEEMIDHIGRLENALKRDIGLYEVEIFEKRPIFKSASETWENLYEGDETR